MDFEEVKKILDALDPVTRDDAYRYLWSDYIRKDVQNYLEDHEDYDEDLEDLSEDEKNDIADMVVEWYVYAGEYDCNLSFNDNLSNLIEDAVKDAKELRESPDKETNR